MTNEVKKPKDDGVNMHTDNKSNDKSVDVDPGNVIEPNNDDIGGNTDRAILNVDPTIVKVK